jgi:hypothetical protein
MTNIGADRTLAVAAMGTWERSRQICEHIRAPGSVGDKLGSTLKRSRAAWEYVRIRWEHCRST